jgi:hypothetical protein
MIDSGVLFQVEGSMQVKAAGIIAILFAHYSAGVTADLSIRYDSIQQSGKQPLHNVLIKQDLVRIDQPAQSAQSAPSVMINMNSGDIVQMDPESRRYFRINAKTINEYASFYQRNKSMLQGLIDHGLAQLDPRKRDQVEGLIEDFENGSRAMKDIDIRPSGRSDQVLGVDCAILGIFNKGKLEREVCISSYDRLGLELADIKSVEQLKGFVQQFRDAAPKRQQQLLRLLGNALTQVDGLPMKVVNYHPDGTIRNIIKASSISFRKIPEQAYRIPGDFQEQNLPVL